MSDRRHKEFAVLLEARMNLAYNLVTQANNMGLSNLTLKQAETISEMADEAYAGIMPFIKELKDGSISH